MHHNVSLNVALPQREIGSISNQHNFKTYAFSNVPRLLKPKVSGNVQTVVILLILFSCSQKSKYITTIDKIFSCEWYNETEGIYQFFTHLIAKIYVLNFFLFYFF